MEIKECKFCTTVVVPLGPYDFYFANPKLVDSVQINSLARICNSEIRVELTEQVSILKVS